MKSGRIYMLKNEHDKCMQIVNPENLFNTAIQGDCNPSERNQHWKRNGQHVCHISGRCLTVPISADSRSDTLPIWEKGRNDPSSRVSETYSGGQLMNQFGWCIGVVGKSNTTGTYLNVEECDSDDKGQHWTFIPII